MGVSNVYNQAKANAISALKSNMASKAKKIAVVNPDLTKNGSIFNMVGRDGTPKVGSLSLAETNVRASLADLNAQPAKASASRSRRTNPDNIADIDNAADGKVAANAVNAQGDKLKGQTVQVKKLGTQVQQFGRDAQTLGAETKKGNKTFLVQQKQQEAQLKLDNQRIERLVKENNETDRQVQDAQHELDSLLASNSFKRGGQGSSGSSADASKINELQTFIGAKVGGMQANGKIIYSLQRSQTRTLAQMQRTNNAYIKFQKTNAKALKNQNTETNKTIETATKIEQYSMITQMGGQALSLAGRGLIALGSAVGPWGAALIATGTIMAKIGTVVELVGQYGQAAANITKTAAYISEGDIGSAMQCCAAAIQSGTAAAKGTANLKNTFGQINNTANDASNKLAARTQTNADIKAAEADYIKQKGYDPNNLTKEQKKDIEKNAFGGMKKSDYKKALTAEYQTQLANNEDVFGRTNKFAETKNKREALKKGQFTNKNGATVTIDKTASQNKVIAQYQKNYQAVLKANGLTEQADQKTLDKVRKKAGNKTVSAFRNSSASSKKSSQNWTKYMEGINQTFSAAASMYMMFNGGMGMGMSGMGNYNNMGMYNKSYSSRNSYNNNHYNTRRYARA